jgi:hypothetical protein
MKYLEELSSGDSFLYNNNVYVITKDFRIKKDNTEFCCINMFDGFVKWIQSNTVVESIVLYYLDNDKNLIAIKEYKDEFTENKNIH